MGYAVAAIIAIIAGVLAWLSLKSWRWANVVLTFLIVCAASTFLYLAAYTLKVQSAWRTRVNEGTAKIERLEAEQKDRLYGIVDETGRLVGGVTELKREVQDWVVRRGPAWFNVERERMGADGSCEVKIETPAPHGVAAQTLVYVFDSAPISDGGAYLGEFRVADAPADGNVVKLQPSMPLDAAQIARLRASRGSWNIYQKMPADENEAFIALTDEEAAKILPPELLESHRSGKRTEAEMSEWVYLFHHYALQKELVSDDIAKIDNNVARLLEAEAINQRKIAYRTQEKANLEADKQGFETELAAITKYAGELEAKSSQLAGELAKARSEMAERAATLKELQLKAAELINQRTATAQAAP